MAKASYIKTLNDLNLLSSRTILNGLATGYVNLRGENALVLGLTGDFINGINALGVVGNAEQAKITAFYEALYPNKIEAFKDAINLALPFAEIADFTDINVVRQLSTLNSRYVAGFKDSIFDTGRTTNTIPITDVISFAKNEDYRIMDYLYPLIIALQSDILDGGEKIHKDLIAQLIAPLVQDYIPTIIAAPKVIPFIETETFIKQMYIDAFSNNYKCNIKALVCPDLVGTLNVYANTDLVIPLYSTAIAANRLGIVEISFTQANAPVVSASITGLRVELVFDILGDTGIKADLVAAGLPWVDAINTEVKYAKIFELRKASIVPDVATPYIPVE
jgi:hypothetical protein